MRDDTAIEIARESLANEAHLKPEIIRLANLYAKQQGWDEIATDVHFENHRYLDRWVTNTGRGAFTIGDPGTYTLSGALAWLREHVNEPR